MYVGNDNVLFVCGTDDHGSTSEVAAHKAGKPVRQFIDEIHALQKDTMERYRIGLDVYSGTSSPDNYPTHEAVCQDMLRKLYQNEMLEKVRSLQWYDPKMGQFLADRYVIGECPRCGHARAYSDECDSCGANYDAEELINPVSTVSGDTPELRETDHWWLDMWKVLDTLKGWVESKSRTWRKLVYNEVMGQVTPSIVFSNQFEETFKEQKPSMPSCKSRYAPGKRIVVAFDNLEDLAKGQAMLGPSLHHSRHLMGHSGTGGDRRRDGR
jgi:methionyl-tRNA synthetase